MPRNEKNAAAPYTLRRNVLSEHEIQQILTVSFETTWEERLSRSRTTTTTANWPGIHDYVFEKHLLDSKYVEAVMVRSDRGVPKKFDVVMKPAWVAGMTASCRPFARIASRLNGQLDECCRYVQWHLMVTSPRSPRQAMHCDNLDVVQGQGGRACYRTVILPLTKDPPEAGGTCFRQGHGGCTHLVNEYGSWLEFDGSVPHYGSANEHKTHTRIFLFAVISSVEKDANNSILTGD